MKKFSGGCFLINYAHLRESCEKGGRYIWPQNFQIVEIKCLRISRKNINASFSTHQMIPRIECEANRNPLNLMGGTNINIMEFPTLGSLFFLASLSVSTTVQPTLKS